jgi:hypothetical protein
MVKRKPKQICKNCKWFKTRGSRFGHCHRYPLVYIPNARMDHHLSDKPRYGVPETYESFQCGEWTPR